MPKPQAMIVPVTPFEQNCTLLWDSDDKEAAVVDPGGDVPEIERAIAEAGVSVRQVLLTHGHIDHAGGAAELAEKLAVPIVGPHQADAFLLSHLAEQAQMFGMVGVRNCTPSRWLAEGDEIRIGGLAFEVRHCPGHTPGHVIFYAAPYKLAVVGDVVFQGSIGRTDFPYGDHAALLKSIREKILVLDDDVGFLCGHGNPSTVGRERTTNPFLA